jgi:hypothetical protein
MLFIPVLIAVVLTFIVSMLVESDHMAIISITAAAVGLGYLTVDVVSRYI